MLKKTTVQTKKKEFDVQAVKLAVLKAVDVLTGIMLYVNTIILKLEVKTKRLHENFLQVTTYSCLLSAEEVPYREQAKITKL